jgi:hypothetical protein
MYNGAEIMVDLETYRWRRLATALLVLGVLAADGRMAGAQTIEESISTLGPENAKAYIVPLSQGLAATLNTGFFHRAATHDVLEFDIGILAMGSWVPASSDMFIPVLPESFNLDGQTFDDPYGPTPGSALESPTVAGTQDGLLLVPQGSFRQYLMSQGQDPSRFNVDLPRGYDVPVVPYAGIQASVGIPLGAEAIVRFLPPVTPSQDVGQISMWGAGLKASVNHWIPVIPIDISFAFGYQAFKVGAYLDSNATQFSMIVGKRLFLFDLYAAGTIQNANLDVSYDFVIPIGNIPTDQTIEFSEGTPNRNTLILGTTLNLGPLGLNGEYTIGNLNVLTASLYFGTP